MARGGARTTRPRTPMSRESRGGLRGNHISPSSERGRHLAVQKTGKLRSLKNQIRGVQRLLEKVPTAPWVHAGCENASGNLLVCVNIADVGVMLRAARPGPSCPQ